MNLIKVCLLLVVLSVGCGKKLTPPVLEERVDGAEIEKTDGSLDSVEKALAEAKAATEAIVGKPPDTTGTTDGNDGDPVVNQEDPAVKPEDPAANPEAPATPSKTVKDHLQANMFYLCLVEEKKIIKPKVFKWDGSKHSDAEVTEFFIGISKPDGTVEDKEVVFTEEKTDSAAGVFKLSVKYKQTANVDVIKLFDLQEVRELYSRKTVAFILDAVAESIPPSYLIEIQE